MGFWIIEKHQIGHSTELLYFHNELSKFTGQNFSFPIPKAKPARKYVTISPYG